MKRIYKFIIRTIYKIKLYRINKRLDRAYKKFIKLQEKRNIKKSCRYNCDDMSNIVKIIKLKRCN